MSDQSTNKYTYTGENFVFHLFKNDGEYLIGMGSEYVYPYASKEDLKGLADFILKYLENK